MAEDVSEESLPLMERAFVPEEQRLVVRGFMCGTDWEHEIGQNAHGIEIWRSERALAAGKKCTHECGMVEVEVRIIRTVKKPAEPLSEEELEWLNSPPVGREII